MSMTQQTRPHDSPALDEATLDDSTAMSDRVRALRLDKADLPAPSTRSRRKLIWGLVIALLIGGVWVYRTKIRPLSQVVEIDAVTVAFEDPVEVVLDATGFVIAKRIVKVSPTIAGRAVEVFVEEGDAVKKGDVLARMDEDQYKADVAQFVAAVALAEARLAELRQGSREEDVEQARASVDQAEARRDQVKKDADRAAELWKSRTIPESEFERSQSNLAEAQAQLNQLKYALKLLESGPRSEQIDASAAEVAKSKAMLAKAQYFLDAAQIRSPIDGTVVELVGELGEYVVPGDINAGYCIIADMNNLQAEIDIPEQELKAIRLGQPCIVTTEAFPDRKYQGRVEWFSPVANRLRGIRRAKIQILNPDEKLLPDLTCRVQIREREAPQGAVETLRVPQEALQKTDGQTFVFVVDDEQKSRLQAIETGAETGDSIEVRQGLKAGDTVLLPGDTPLGEGQLIRPRARAKKEAA